MKSLCLTLGAVALSLSTNYSAASEPDRPLIPVLKAEEIQPLCDKGISDLRKHVSATEALPKAHAGDANKVFADWNRLQIEIEDLQGPLDLLSNVSPDKTVRSNAEA
jgi:thimet oligopeptidase